LDKNMSQNQSFILRAAELWGSRLRVLNHCAWHVATVESLGSVCDH